MARDIEEFLRRAAERRKQQQQKKQQGGAAPSQRIRQIVENEDIEVVQPVEVVPPKLVRKPLVRKKDLRHESVAEHVQSHIDSSSIAQHAEHLGDRIQTADDRIAERLQRKFSHDVSKLDDLPSVQDDVVATVTKADISQISKEIIEMLRTSDKVRQAIVVCEILKRPNFD